MVLRSSSSALTDLRIVQLSSQTVSSTSQSTFFPASGSLTFSQVTVGLFRGSVRNLRLQSAFLDDATVYRSQFNYLYPSPSNKILLVLDSLNGLQNQAGIATATVIGSPRPTNDSLGIIQCTTQQTSNYQRYLMKALTMSGAQSFLPYNLTVLWNKNFSTSTSYQAWLFHQPSAKPVTEVLFSQPGLLTIQFSGDILTAQTLYGSVSGNVPWNQWVFVQVQNTPSQLSLTLFDVNGSQLQFANLTSVSNTAQPSPSL